MKKNALPLPFLLFLALLAAQIVLSFGTTLALLGMLWHDVFGFVILRLFQTAGFLLLLFTLGTAIGALQDGKQARAYFFLIAAVAAHFFGAILSLFWQALFFYQAISAAELSLLLGSIMDSSILPLFISLILAHAIYLREPMKDTPKDRFDFSSPTIRATAMITLVIFVYRFAGQVMESIQFIEDAVGYVFLTPSEKWMLYLDYIPVFGASILGYFILLGARSLYFRVEARRQRKHAVTK